MPSSPVISRLGHDLLSPTYVYPFRCLSSSSHNRACRGDPSILPKSFEHIHRSENPTQTLPPPLATSGDAWHQRTPRPRHFSRPQPGRELFDLLSVLIFAHGGGRGSRLAAFQMAYYYYCTICTYIVCTYVWVDVFTRESGMLPWAEQGNREAKSLGSQMDRYDEWVSI